MGSCLVATLPLLYGRKFPVFNLVMGLVPLIHSGTLMIWKEPRFKKLLSGITRMLLLCYIVGVYRVTNVELENSYG